MNIFGLTGRAKITTAGVAAVAAGALVLPASAAPTQSAPPTTQPSTAFVQQAAAAPGTLTSRVRGTFGRNGTVRGTFAPDRFFMRGGETYANGVLRATMRRADGTLVGRATRRVSVPVRGGSAQAAQAQVAGQGQTCDILNLVLGPLDLNLLGLEVHLNRVVLDIVARRGAGNLLGNLLCAVAGLLDGTGTTNALRLANVLNRVLSVLRLG
jgi:hypothetical protein